MVVPLVTVMAQTQSPAPSPTNPPEAMKPETSAPPAALQTTPPTMPSDKKAAAPATASQLKGLAAKSSDGTNLGTVQSVTTEPGGKVIAIVVKVGGFLGFGGHMVTIPDGKFTRTGDTVQVSMTADEVNKLPETETKKQS